MLPVGKLDSDVLKRIVIDKIKYKCEDVKVRAGVGEDCARLKLSSARASQAGLKEMTDADEGRKTPLVC